MRVRYSFGSCFMLGSGDGLLCSAADFDIASAEAPVECATDLFLDVGGPKSARDFWVLVEADIVE